MRGLYLVTPNWDDTDHLLAVSEAAIDGGASLLQYRHKDASPALRLEQAGALLALCRRRQIPCLINDHVELCAAIDADGVHLGGTDAPVAAVRAQLGKDKIIGASCYGELDLARLAEQAGASYAAFGGFYPSLVKKYSFVTSPAILDQAKAELRIPLIVIGGMTPLNAAPLAARGADMVAAISSIYNAAEPTTVSRQFMELFAL